MLFFGRSIFYSQREMSQKLRFATVFCSMRNPYRLLIGRCDVIENLDLNVKNQTVN